MYKSLYYVYVVAKNAMEQKKKVIFQMMNHVIFLLFSMYLYKYVYELLPGMKSKLPYSNAIWSMSMYFVVFWLEVKNIHSIFRTDIRSGNIEMYLLRPIGYIWQKVLTQIGQGAMPFLSALATSVFIDCMVVGAPQVNTPILIWILGLVLIFILSQVLSFMLYILCGLSGFWLHDSFPVYFIISKFIMIFGGAWVPVAFFPKTLQLIAEYSPFGASMSISYAMYPNFGERFVPLVLNLLCWIFVCGLCVYFISKKAFKNLSVNG